jgi:hypothetical protein
MRASKIATGLGLFILVSGLAFGKVRIDYDHGVNFYKYRTYKWVQEPSPKNPFMKERLIKAIDAQLMAKGFEPSDCEACLAVSAKFTTEEQQTLNTYYSGGGWGWGWGGSGWATTYVETREVGTLVVDLLDARTKKPLWRGVATHTVSSKPEKAAKKFREEIEEMFEKFPPS